MQFVPFYRRLDKEFVQFESEGTEQGTQTSCVYLLVYHEAVLREKVDLPLLDRHLFQLFGF